MAPCNRSDTTSCHFQLLGERIGGERGVPIKIICRELGLSEGTVRTHVTAIYRAFNVSNRTEGLLAARHLGYNVR